MTTSKKSFGLAYAAAMLAAGVIVFPDFIASIRRHLAPPGQVGFRVIQRLTRLGGIFADVIGADDAIKVIQFALDDARGAPSVVNSIVEHI